MPTDLANELMKCTTDAEAKAIGIEWCTMQARELIASKVPSIHFYSLNATRSVEQIARTVY